MSFLKKSINNKFNSLTQNTKSFIKDKNFIPNQNKFNNSNFTQRHKLNFKSLSHYIKEKIFSQNKLSNKNIHSEKNLLEKNPKNALFNQIKKLIADFEEEKKEKKLKDKDTLAKKDGNRKGKLKKPKPKGENKLTSLVIPQNKVYYVTPKVKSKMQLNRYLINDFKENDSEQDYIKRSKKYQKMNEELDELIILKQIKEAEKNGISQKVENEKVDEEFFNIGEKFGSLDSEINNEEKFSGNKSNSKNSSRKKLGEKRNSIFSNNHYNLSLRRLYTDNAKDLEKRNYTINKNIKILKNNQKSRNIINPILNTREKNPENENLTIDINKGKKLNKSKAVKFLMDQKKRRSSLVANMTKYTIISRRGSIPRLTKKKSTKKVPMDKFTFSNKLYKDQINDYNKYLKNKQIMRGKNFSKQLALFEKEKERFGIIYNEESEGGGLPKLNHTKLLYELEFKDIFKNSFNTMRLFEEGDQDLDLDNLNKIKQLIKDYEIEMTHILKISDNPNYIKRNFNKSTIGKYFGY